MWTGTWIEDVEHNCACAIVTPYAISTKQNYGATTKYYEASDQITIVQVAIVYKHAIVSYRCVFVSVCT